MTVREQMALRMAATAYSSARAREVDAYWQVGLSAAPYHALVLRLLERADAEREMPAEVHRLRRLRDKRRAARRNVDRSTQSARQGTSSALD